MYHSRETKRALRAVAARVLATSMPVPAAVLRATVAAITGDQSAPLNADQGRMEEQVCGMGPRGG